MIDDLNQLKQVLNKLHICPSKQKGQNFLYDHDVIDQIAQSVLDCQTSNVIEIGPGLGAISDQVDNHLKSSQYKLIEVDNLLYNYLLTKNYHAQVIHADCLKLDWQTLTNSPDFLVFGNLPYSVGTLILMKWINTRVSSTAIFMLQKEVVDRLISPVKKKATEAWVSLLN